MSEQNNNCETCGNNKELDGSCFDCDHQRECGICYETKRWSCCDGGDFVEGMNCDHEVCFDCSLRITRCPFCRRPWIEDETDLFAELMETGDVADPSGVNYQVRIYYRDGDMDFLPNSDSDSGSSPDYSTLELVNYNYFQFIEWIETDAVYQGRAVIRVELTSTTATDEEEYPAPEVLDTLDLTSHWTTEE